MQETTPRRYNLVEDEDKLSVSLLDSALLRNILSRDLKTGAVFVSHRSDIEQYFLNSHYSAEMTG